MTDPFDALREPVVPTDPDPDFAASLRARIERALALPRGVAVTSTIVEQPRTAALGAAIPYLAVPNGSGRRALDWYVEVLDARLVGEPMTMDDGRIGHAELALSGGTLYLAEEFPEIGVVAPSPAGTPVSLSLQVPDVAETMRRAISRGGTMPRPMYDDYGSRNVTIVDPFGHRWLLHTPLDLLPETDRQGDVGYAWLTVPDPDRAAAFYAAVLGWDYAPGHASGGRQVVGQSLSMGYRPRASRASTSPTRWTTWPRQSRRVRAAGANVVEPGGAARSGTCCRRRRGRPRARCSRAATGPCSGPAGRRRTAPARATCPYLTLEVVDSDPVPRPSYGRRCIGDTVQPVSAASRTGWSGARGSAPMDRDAAGPKAATPRCRCGRSTKVAAAVEAGPARPACTGRTDPERQPYGTTSEATDDQGVRFYLGDA
jgi:uncharacterized glyoxalase superfamily protein PhnB